MAKFRKKPVVIEAFQFGIDVKPDWFMDKVTSNNIVAFSSDDLKNPQDYYCEIKTLEGVMRGNLRDYIIRGVQGEIYPCKPEIFEATYEIYEMFEKESCERAPVVDREPTVGERAIGVSFNPSNMPEVDQVKANFAQLFDLIEDNYQMHTRLGAMLKTEAELNCVRASMSIVKLITFKE